ncbi:hypothetical protein C7S14_1224 [Burkholderia cepacia]|nr:hypothetical protein C7S14_1224 [Burkholderia cepacia]
MSHGHFISARQTASRSRRHIATTRTTTSASRTSYTRQ